VWTTTGQGIRAASRATGSGVYLGQGSGGWAWAGPERSTLVLGPSRSGKTSSIVIPNVLAAPGAVLSTSTKADVLEATAPVRSEAGWTLLYDPSGSVDTPPTVQRVGWSPVRAAREWDGAVLIAEAMVRTARAVEGVDRLTGADHWSERATALLAPLLHAAAMSGEPMATVLHWVDRHDGADALSRLAATGGPACDVLSGILSTDGREQSGIWSTASGALGAYRSRAALASTVLPPLDADRFCAGANTLYICAAGRRQRQLAPMVVGMVTEIRDAAYRRAAAGAASPPVLAVLDEAANIAPLPDLPGMVTEGAGQGLLTLACLQDLSQARSRWGREADAFLSLFGTTVVLGGIADLPTLRAISALAGEREVPTRTIGLSPGADRGPRPSASVATVRLPRLPVDAIARGAPGAAIALDAHNRVGWVGLTPAHRCAPWFELTRAPRTLAAPYERIR